MIFLPALSNCLCILFSLFLANVLHVAKPCLSTLWHLIIFRWNLRQDLGCFDVSMRFHFYASPWYDRCRILKPLHDRIKLSLRLGRSNLETDRTTVEQGMIRVFCTSPRLSLRAITPLPLISGRAPPIWPTAICMKPNRKSDSGIQSSCNVQPSGVKQSTIKLVRRCFYSAPA